MDTSIIIKSGYFEYVEDGIPNNKNRNLCSFVPKYILLFIYSPINSLLFILVLLFQFLSSCLYKFFGNQYLYNPSQTSYIHALYVIRNTLLGWKKTYLSEKIGVLANQVMIGDLPQFIYNENSTDAEVLTFDRYSQEIKNIPKYSGKYRSIDGSGNHKEYPFLGQGGRGYSKFEPFQLRINFPSSQEIVDTLFKRNTFKPAIHGANGLATWFANVAIHDLFRSHPDKPWINLHSSYLDLQVLYGYNQESMEKTRSYQNGKLKQIGEDRLNRVVESKAIIELLRREHNYICDQLKDKYPFNFNTDESIYQQARLIMGGVFINIILRSYGCQMFGESAPNGRGFTELRQKYPGKQYGNHNNINFNLLYQWHNSIPVETNIKNRPNIDTDEQLRKLFGNMLNWRSGALVANNTPTFLLPVAKKLIDKARICGTSRLNDFRRFLGIPYKSIEEMCGGNKELISNTKKFYPTIEDVELVVGVQIEKSTSYGWGLPDTVGNSILKDAFSTIINDRFYTDDYHPKLYTEWGYQHTKNTIIADLLNRHLDMNLDRNQALEKLPDWKPPTW